MRIVCPPCHLRLGPTQRCAARSSGLWFVVFALLAGLLTAAPAAAQQSLADVVGTHSSLKRPVSNPREFLDLLKQTEVSTGDGQMLAYIDAAKLSKRQYLHLYLMARASAAGWFRSLQTNFGATAPPCNEQALSLQTYFVASYEEPTWCVGEQYRAAQWLYATLNNVAGRDDDWAIRKIYFLLHSAFSDLSALEVHAAVTGRPSTVAARVLSKPVSQPYKSELASTKSLSTFEGWEPWVTTQDARLPAADAVLFARQTVSAKFVLGMRFDLLRPGTLAGIFTSNSSRYLVGNELVLRGAFGLSFKSRLIRDPRPNFAPEDEYAGLYVLANSIVLDSAEAGRAFGYLDYDDFYQYPTLTINGSGSTGAILMARKLALGSRQLERIRRVWQLIGESEYPTSGKCGMDSKVLMFSRKQISQENLMLPGLETAIASDGCFDRLFSAWQSVLQSELDSRPSNVIHRHVHVILSGIRQPVFARGNVESAATYFGTKVLEQWNLAAVKQLLLQVQSAQLQDDREQVGLLMRDAEGIRSRFLVNPTSSTVTEILEVFEKLSKVREGIRGRRLIIRGASLPEAPAIAGSILLGDAASKDTWLLPTSVALRATEFTPAGPKFARVLVTDPMVRVQIQIALSAPTGLQRAVKAALQARGLRYVGVAEDVQFQQIRQTSSVDWSIEDQVQVAQGVYLLTIRCSQAYFPVLLDQLARRPGLPISVDWKHLVDESASSASVGPISGAISFQAVPGSLRITPTGSIENRTQLPAEIVALSRGSGEPVPVYSPFLLPALMMVPVSGLGASANDTAGVDVALIRWDPAAAVAPREKVAFVAPSWSLVPIQLHNQSDLVSGKSVRSVMVTLTPQDDKGAPILQPIIVNLGRFGMPDARREVKLFLPPGFRIQYSSQYIAEDGTKSNGPSSQAEGLQIVLRALQ